ncbi:hypothetical protein RIR_jg12164.t1 [Rhizophagus irregularis DAOM 181602=DAOM 197198]|nr:hypothetical protein RIR_jg12164.t1 [Rhizophagus irregularis DAOM 181602=DAOM 197198]
MLNKVALFVLLLSLKSFFNIDNVTAKEIVHELKLQRDIQFHNNIIKFYGIAKFDPENDNVQSKNYLLVMEYADSGPLKNYLKENFNILTWNDKYNLAYQLACAVSCIHNEGIVHRDLHSGNVLVHQNTIKLSDFGGQPPFYTEGEQYDVDLAIEISQGLREEPIPNTPEDYIKIYTECWNGEPDNRPTINQVVERLKEIIAKMNITTENNISASLNTDNSASEQGHTLAQLYVGLCYQLGHGTTKDGKLSLKYYEKIASMGCASGLLRVGYCYYHGIGTSVNYQKAVMLYKQAANLGNYTSQNNLGVMYEEGKGVDKDYDKAFELYYKTANSGFSIGQYNLARMYYNGRGVDKDYEKALGLYYRSANSGYNLAQYNIAVMYEYGIGIKKDVNQAIYWYEKSAEQGVQEAQDKLKELKYK